MRNEAGEAYVISLYNMKAHLTTGALLAAMGLVFGGCAEQRPTTVDTSTTHVKTDPAQDNYTRHELERTGQAQPGAALRSADPDVTR